MTIFRPEDLNLSWDGRIRASKSDKVRTSENPILISLLKIDSVCKALNILRAKHWGVAHRPLGLDDFKERSLCHMI